MTNQEIATNMRAIIAENLSGPGGDPGWGNLVSAAVAFHVLDALGLLDEANKEKCVRDTLEGDNVHQDNFLELDMAYGQSPIVKA